MSIRSTLAVAFGMISLSVLPSVYSPVSLGIGTEEYFGTEYTTRPIEESTFMFYMGERIRLKVDFFNSGETTETIPLAGRNASMLFDTEATKDGASVPLRVRFDPALDLEGPDGTTRAVLGSALTLAPGQTLTIHGEVASIPQEAGVFAIEVSTDLVDTSGRPIAPQSTRFDFELRPITKGEALEVARRKAARALSDEQFDQADKFAAELLAMYPNSSTAYLLRGHAAKALGRSSDALAMYRRALNILESNTDSQYLLFVGSLEREENIAGVRNTIRRLGGQ